MAQAERGSRGKPWRPWHRTAPHPTQQQQHHHHHLHNDGDGDDDDAQVSLVFLASPFLLDRLLQPWF